jgi:UDP-N-acetylglucosamine--N-acetylmuramyl-(pentapeptide) pyrophosphoryl-undecaprenol N-acetylglucosamine transferase
LKKIILTGGGTAGHVTPNIALMPSLAALGWQIEYIGSHQGIEQDLITELGIPYHGITSGKLRRYLDLQNFSDPFKVLKGLVEAYFLLGKLKPSAVFSKGGFVTVPVILASWLRRIPVVIHESDITPGLANKISIPFATKICVSFPETLKYIPNSIYTGLPIRTTVLHGNPEVGRQLCSFNRELPILLVIGGSTGSAKINHAVREILDKLTNRFQVVHVCGKGNVEAKSAQVKNYQQFDYLGTELADIFAAADLVVSRSGANSIFELLALRKPNLLIPLSKASSRGDQILNAQSFQKAGYSAVLPEEEITKDRLWQEICQLYEHKHKYTEKMNTSWQEDSVEKIVNIIDQMLS